MDETLKQNGLVAFAAFNLTIIAYQIFLNSSPFSWARLVLGILIALVVGGIAFGIARFLANR